MIKIIGALLLICGATVIGLTGSSELSFRARMLGEFTRLLSIMKSEICEHLTPLDELLKRIAEVSGEPWHSFFSDCADEMRRKSDVPFGIIWSKLLRKASYLHLKPQEEAEITALGNILGRYSADEQGRAIAHTLRCVSAMAECAENERGRLGKLYTKLGVICGISVVIVFI